MSTIRQHIKELCRIGCLYQCYVKFKLTRKFQEYLFLIENLDYLPGLIENSKGIPLPTLTALAYSNSRFCILKFTKPDDERDLQVPAIAARANNAA